MTSLKETPQTLIAAVFEPLKKRHYFYVHEKKKKKKKKLLKNMIY